MCLGCAKRVSSGGPPVPAGHVALPGLLVCSHSPIGWEAGPWCGEAREQGAKRRLKVWATHKTSLRAGNGKPSIELPLEISRPGALGTVCNTQPGDGSEVCTHAGPGSQGWLLSPLTSLTANCIELWGGAANGTQLWAYLAFRAGLGNPSHLQAQRPCLGQQSEEGLQTPEAALRPASRDGVAPWPVGLERLHGFVWAPPSQLQGGWRRLEMNNCSWLPDVDSSREPQGMRVWPGML